jgi:hypothetical protein
MSLEKPSIPPTQVPDTKVLQDLSTVIEKINLCTTMLHPLNSTEQVDQDESLLTIIGFLEACVPRVRELIEAGMTGALKEDTVVKCLAVNDSLCQVLEFVEHPEKCLPAAAAAGGGANNGSSNIKTDQKKQQKDSSFQEFDAFGITDDDFFATSLDANDSKLPAKKDTSTTATVPPGTQNTKKSSALEDLLLTPSDALPTPPPSFSSSSSSLLHSSSTGFSGTSNVNTTKSDTASSHDQTTNIPNQPNNDVNTLGKDPIQDDFDRFFDD